MGDRGYQGEGSADYRDAAQMQALSRTIDRAPFDSQAAILQRIAQLELAVGRLANAVDLRKPSTALERWRCVQGDVWPLFDQAGALLSESPPDDYREGVASADAVAACETSSHRAQLAARARALMLLVAAGPRHKGTEG